MVIIALLLNPIGKNINTVNVTIKTDRSQKSPLDTVLFAHLDILRLRPNLIKALTTPATTVNIKSLWVDKAEVAQGDFYKFVGWSRVHDTSQFFAQDHPQNWRFHSASKEDGLSGKLGVSANGVAFYDAYSYCRAAAGRLPTADEFYAISQAQSGQLYPWGNQFDPKPWPYFDARLNATLKSGSFPSSNNRAGVQDLGAVLAEWTLGEYPDGKPYIQGGDAYSTPHEIYALNAVYRKVAASYRSIYVGFRCVYDAAPKGKTRWKSKIEAIRIKDKKAVINHYPNSVIRPLLHYLPRLSVATFKSLLPINRKANYQILVGTNEISVAQYQRFLAAPLVSLGFAHEQQPKEHSLTPLGWQQQLQNPQRPVVGVDWWSAYHFANWADGRLPTQDEFIKILALSGSTDGVFAENSQAHPTDLQPTTTITNLLGNVAEWSASVDSSQQNLQMVVKGGSFLTPQPRAQDIAHYQSISPHHRSNSIGFRVVFE